MARPLCVPVGGGPPASRPRRVLLLVAPLVFRAPSGPAAREIATREPAARSGRSRSPPVPSGPSGALHTGGAWCTDVWLGASAQSLARPRRRPPAPRQIPPAPSAPVGPGVLGWGWRVALKPGQAPPRPSISHVIPRRLVQTLNLQRWNCNVFEVSRKMTTINYVRNVGGGGVAAVHGCRSRARRPQVPQSGPASGGTPVARVPSRRRWGFCSIRNWLAACRRRVGSLMTPIPPFGDGEITV